MKTYLKSIFTSAFALIAAFAAGSALAEQMYVNPLATDGSAVVAIGTYGDIEVTGAGYQATAFTARTKIMGGTGSYSGIVSHIGDATDIRNHTVSGWFKLDALDRMVYAVLAYTGGDHGGYKVYCNSSGNLEIGKCNGSNFGWNGSPVTATAGLTAGAWHYLTIAVSHTESERNATAQVFLDGAKIYDETTTFPANLNGNNCIDFSIGAGVSAAGLYIDTTAVTDVETIKGWAVNPDFVDAAHESRAYEFAEPIDDNWSTLDNWWIGDDPATELPTEYDTVTFPTSRKAYNVVLPGEVKVKAITMQSPLANFKDGAIVLKNKGVGSTIMGTATLVFDGGLPDSSIEGQLQNTDWKGTVWLKNATGLTNIDFAKYANANTTVKCTGISGYFAPNKEFTSTLELENGEASYALNIHNGSSNDGNVVTFDKLTGAGKILGDGGSTAGFLVKDWSGFTGDVELNNKTVTFGDVRKANVNKIIVNPGFAYMLSGQTWTANGGIQIDGTIGGKGTLASAVTFGLDATVDATAGIPTVNALPTFALTNRFVVAEAPTAGSPVKVLAADVTLAAKTFEVIPVIVVGGDEVEGNFQVKVASDGIYLEKVSGEFAIETADATVTASVFNAGELASADGSSIVTITLMGENPTVVLDESIKGGDIKIVHEGALTISADAEPADFYKYDLRGVTGFIRYSWLAMRRVINLNFNSGSGAFAADDSAAFDGLLAGNTPKLSWVNLTGAANSGVAVSNIWNVATSSSNIVEGLTVSWNANVVYEANQTIPVLKGYLDDGNPNGVKITLKGVPFETYDVIVYYNTDMANRVYPAVKVNGAAYTWDAEQGKTVFGTNNWGRTRYDGVAYGDNALRIPDVVGDAVITTAKRDDGQSLRGCVPAIQIVEVEKKEIVNSYEAEGDVRVSELNKIVTDGYVGGFTLTLHGGALIFDKPFVCAALTVNSTGDLTITTDGAEIASEELAKVVPNDVAGVITYGFAVSPLATALNGVVYTVGVGTEDAPAPISYVANGSMTLKDGTFYIGTTYAATMSTVNFVDATIYGLGDGGLGVGNETFNLSGSTAVVSENFILSQGGAGRTSVFTMGDTSSVKVTGSSIVDSNQSSIMFGHYNGPSTFTMNDSAVFDATNAQVLVGKTSNNQTINLNGGTFIAKGIKVSSGAGGVNTLNWIGGELKLGEYGITSYNANRITVNVTNEVTLTATDATLPLSQPIAGSGTIRKQGEGVLELTSSLADFTGKIVADAADVISLTNNVLPLADGMLAKIEGTVVINATKGDSWFKICEDIEMVLENLTILDMEGQAISPLCIVDGDLYYGIAEGTFELQPADLAAIKALTAGGVYSLEKPTLAISEICTNLPDGFGFKREGATLYFFKKSNSISYKFGTRTDNKASAILSSDTDVGGFPVAGVVWNNGRIWNKNNAAFNDYVKLMDGNGEMTEATLAYRAPNTYFNKDCPLDSGNQRLTSTYLDDGADAGSTTYTNNYSSQGLEIPEGGIVLPAAPNARGWEMKLSDIPYEMYDLYVYIASDQSQDGFKGCPVVVSIDGVHWTYYAGAKVGSDSSDWTPDVYSKDGTVTEGKNYIRFRISKASMQADDISTIYLTHGTRNTGAKKRIGLAGIQIVEIDDDGVRNYVGTGDWVADDAWQTSKGESVEWKDAEEGDVLTAIINADTLDSITINSNVVVTTVKLVGNDPDRVFTLKGANTLAAQSIDASGFKGTLRLEGVLIDAPVGLGVGGVVRMPIEHWGDYEIVGGSVVMEIEGDKSGFAIPTGTKIDNPLLEVLDGATLSFVDWTFRGTVQVDEGGVYDMVGRNGSTGFHSVILNGGTLKNGTEPTGPAAPGYINKTFQVINLKLIADSTLDIPYVSGLVNQGWGATTLDLGTNTLTKTGDALFTFANTTITGSGTVKVDDGTVSFDGYKIPEGTTLNVEVSEGATAKLANASGKGVTNNGTINIVNKGGTVDIQTSVTVGDFLGTGTTTIADNQTLTVSGTADYPLVPTATVFNEDATIRLGTGQNVLKDEPLWCSGAVTLDAVDGAKFKGAGEFIWCEGEITMTEAFKNALKESGREANIVTDEIIGSLVEIKMIPRFLIMLK